MKVNRFSFLVIGLVTLTAMARQAAAQSLTPPNVGATAVPDFSAAVQPDKTQVSLAFGNYYARVTTNVIAQNFGVEMNTDLDPGKFIEGFTNFISGSPAAMTEHDMTNLLTQEVAYLRGKVQRETKAMIDAGPDTMAAGAKFLATNATLPGVSRLASGVEYKVIKDGDGALPTAGDVVTLKIIAERIDGTVVGTILNEMPMTDLRPLPPVYTNVLAMMKAGSHWITYVPYDLAYGDKPALGNALHTPKVPPYSALIFDIELQAVQPRPTSQGMPQSLAPNGTPPMRPPTTQVVPQTSSDIVRVPSADELKRGSNIEVMTLQEAIKKSQTNPPATP